MCIRDRNNAIINFRRRVLELNNEGKQITVNFERVLDTVKMCIRDSAKTRGPQEIF